MFDKILCSTDGSDHSNKALDLAIDMAKKYDARLVILHVPHRSENIDALQRFAKIEGLAQHVNTEIKRPYSMDYRINLVAGSDVQDSGISPRLLVEVGQHILDGAKDCAEQNGLENVDARLDSGDPTDSILRCIDEENIDCVVMGKLGLSNIKADLAMMLITPNTRVAKYVKDRLLGSVSDNVANHAPCTCITVE